MGGDVPLVASMERGGGWGRPFGCRYGAVLQRLGLNVCS